MVNIITDDYVFDLRRASQGKRFLMLGRGSTIGDGRMPRGQRLRF